MSVNRAARSLRTGLKVRGCLQTPQPHGKPQMLTSSSSKDVLLSWDHFAPVGTAGRFSSAALEFCTTSEGLWEKQPSTVCHDH